MKNILLEITEVVDRHAYAIFFLPILASLIIGVSKNYGAITNHHSSMARRIEGLKSCFYCLICGLSCIGVFISGIAIAFYFGFGVVEMEKPMYNTIVPTGLFIGLVFNFNLLVDVSLKKQLKGIIRAFATIFVIVIVVFACSQVFIH